MARHLQLDDLITLNSPDNIANLFRRLGYDVEKLTKSFYKGYKTLFDMVQRVIKENNIEDTYFQYPDRLHQFSQRLLGRIMFLYFLQKKEVGIN